MLEVALLLQLHAGCNIGAIVAIEGFREQSLQILYVPKVGPLLIGNCGQHMHRPISPQQDVANVTEALLQGLAELPAQLRDDLQVLHILPADALALHYGAQADQVDELGVCLA